MDWQIAKELRDAGYPQRIGAYFVNPLNHADRAAAPDLDDLTQECRGFLRSLAQEPGGWLAIGQSIGTGRTVEEAVARLWLLRRKQLGLGPTVRKWTRTGWRRR